MEEIVAVDCKVINGNGDGAMLFQDIGRKVDNGGAGNRSKGNTFGLPLKQFGRRTINSNAATDISSSNRTVCVVV